jgi:hypothetical protein
VASGVRVAFVAAGNARGSKARVLCSKVRARAWATTASGALDADEDEDEDAFLRVACPSPRVLKLDLLVCASMLLEDPSICFDEALRALRSRCARGEHVGMGVFRKPGVCRWTGRFCASWKEDSSTSCWTSPRPPPVVRSFPYLCAQKSSLS